MERCSVCNGRTMLSPEGAKCLNSQCEGSKAPQQKEGVLCRCGEPMHYKGLNSWGEPNYACMACGSTAKL